MSDPEKPSRWYLSGAALQGLALGFLLAVAIVEILVLASGAQLFKYQGF